MKLRFGTVLPSKVRSLIISKSMCTYVGSFVAENKLVRIGYMTNIQDGTVIEEVPEELGPDHDGSVMIGNQVTVGMYLGGNERKYNQLTSFRTRLLPSCLYY